MLRASRWPSLIVTPVMQTLLAQYPCELIRTQAAQIVNKILRHKYFVGVHGLAQQVFIHIANSWYLCKNFPVVCCFKYTLDGSYRLYSLLLQKNGKGFLLLLLSLHCSDPILSRQVCLLTHNLTIV